MSEITYGPPSPIHLDGITFFNDRQEHEFAYRGSLFIGEIDQGDGNDWGARKFFGASLGDWKPMRSAAEARAFIVSRIRQ